MRRERGFTLLELMIVIAVISVVAAITIPNLMAAREHAKEGQVVASLKGLVSMQAMFLTNDYDGDGTADFGDAAEFVASGCADLEAFDIKDFDLVMTVSEDRLAWSAVATPLNPSFPRTFFVDQTGVIRFTMSPDLAGPTSRAVGE
ncbi:MAG: prepilin-type N-terminal cleavage/methylation domain-containing protein [Planctomycetota bacterium]